MRITLPIHYNDLDQSKNVIYQFQKENRFLSNFWPCHVILPAEENLPALPYNSVENAYMAWKTLDLDTRLLIQSLSPSDAKKLSYTDNFTYREPYRDEDRISIMRTLVRQKFSENNHALLSLLKKTDRALIIEGNTHGDSFFGFDLDKGYGQNHLGRITMDVRQERFPELTL